MLLQPKVGGTQTDDTDEGCKSLNVYLMGMSGGKRPAGSVEEPGSRC